MHGMVALSLATRGLPRYLAHLMGDICRRTIRYEIHKTLNVYDPFPAPPLFPPCGTKMPAGWDWLSYFSASQVAP